MRELWLPTLMDRRPYGQWQERRDGPREWAREKAQSILLEHHPAPLDPALSDELQRLIQEIPED